MSASFIAVNAVVDAFLLVIIAFGIRGEIRYEARQRNLIYCHHRIRLLEADLGFEFLPLGCDVGGPS